MTAEEKFKIREAVADAKKSLLRAIRLAESFKGTAGLTRKLERVTGMAETIQRRLST